MGQRGMEDDPLVDPPLPGGERAGVRGFRRSRVARSLRQRQTDAEIKFWSRVRAGRFLGLKFRRQVPIDRFVVDFVCAEKRLIIELDGGGHAERVDFDTKRTELLEALGYIVLRFWNHDVLLNCDAVLESVWVTIGSPTAPPEPPLPDPLPSRERGRRR